MEKGGGKKWLVVTLSVLAVVIVGLIVGIVVVNLSRRVDTTDTTDIVEDGDILPSHEELAKGEYDIGYNISYNISKIYNTENKDEALELYEREIDAAIQVENYDLFLELMATRATMLIFDNRCDEAVATYDDVNPDILPAEYKVAFYSSAATESNTCGNAERERYYSDLFNQFIEEDEDGSSSYMEVERYD